MLKIFVGLIMTPVGVALLMASMHSSGSDEVPLALLGTAFCIGGLVAFLLGIKAFFLQEIIDELKRINGLAKVELKPATKDEIIAGSE